MQLRERERISYVAAHYERLRRFLMDHWPLTHTLGRGPEYEDAT